MKTFADFEIWIGPQALPSGNGERGIFPVQVFSAPAGPATGELALDMDADDFRVELAQVRGIDPNLELRQSFGGRLFQALFTGEVRDAWQRSWGRVDEGDVDGLRLRLWITVPQLAALPWELLWDAQSEGFLATAANLVVSRYLPVPEPPRLPAQDKLRILIVVESPPGLPPNLPQIDPEEIDEFEAAVKGLGDAVECKLLRNATRGQIQNALQQDYHVLHFLGHGRVGQLVVTADDGQGIQLINDREFAQFFQGRRSLRLVVLSACHSSQAEAGGLFAGIGPALVQKRMPAVVAMQYPFVQLETAGRFSRAFYQALANGVPVDVAVNEARQLLSAGELLGDRDWSTPVLYMGTRNGRILDFLGDEADTVERAWHSVQTVAQESDEATAALQELAQRFQEIADRQRALTQLMTLSNQLRDLRAGFSQCTGIVERAGWNVANLQFNDLGQAWAQVRQNRLDPLRVFVADHPELDTAAWFPALTDQATSIDTNLAQVALVPLANSVRTFENQLAQAEAHVRQRLDGAVATLLAFSDQTLGRLAIA